MKSMQIFLSGLVLMVGTSTLAVSAYPSDTTTAVASGVNADLLAAAKAGQADRIQELISKGANIETGLPRQQHPDDGVGKSLVFGELPNPPARRADPRCPTVAPQLGRVRA